jgi:hypothetical protein
MVFPWFPRFSHGFPLVFPWFSCGRRRPIATCGWSWVRPTTIACAPRRRAAFLDDSNLWFGGTIFM